VNLVPGRRVVGVAVYLSPEVDYLGRVVDPDDRPVAGAQVVVLDAASGERTLLPLQDRYQSDAKGEFHFHAPDNSVLEAHKEPFLPGRGWLDFSARLSRRLVIKLEPASARSRAPHETISGHVVDDHGTPVDGALVLAESEHGQAEAMSDAQGRFTLEGLYPDAFDVIASHDGLAPAEAKAVRTGTRDLTLSLTLGGSLHGTVTDAESGRPIGSFAINLWRRPDPLRLQRVAGRAFVEPTGDYSVDGLPIEKLVASVSAPGHAATQEFDVDIVAPPAPPAIANFQLKRGARLIGTVADRTTHRPIEGARVDVQLRWAQEAASSATPGKPPAISDSEGRFVLTGLSAGPVSITVSASGHHGRALSNLTAPESGDMQPVTVELTLAKENEEPKVERVSIGVGIAVTVDGMRIVMVAPGSGAEAAGLAAGDLLLAVEGKAVKDLGFEGTVALLRGEEGTSVTLLVRRADGTQASFTAQRKAWQY
jgi:hypothetical protein